MVHKIRKYISALLVLIATVNGYTQNRVDSIGFNHADLNGAATVKTVLIGFDRCSGLSYAYNSVKLYQYLSLGKDYKYGEAANSASVTLTIDLYNTPSGGTGLMQSFTNIVIAINQDAPEKEYIQDITSLVKAGAIRAVITRTAYSCSTPYQSRIRLASFYKEDVGVDVRGKSVSTGTPTVKNPVAFIWSRNTSQQCIPNYQVQVLRLFNRDPAKGSNELLLYDTIRWSKAVTIETGSPDTTLLLTLAEGRGYYAWRVRPVGTLFQGGAANWRNYGNWNSTSLTEGTLVNITSTNPYGSGTLFFYYQFNNDKNWIYSRTFSEGDPLHTKVRMRESMTFGNGLQQVKQNQSRQQSSNKVLANQTIYDYSGRAALTTLPAPVDSVPGGDTLGYFNGFIKVGATLYTAQHFDDNSTFNNPAAATAGALINYYSNTNTDTFVPNAEGYPYSRTLYQKDGTGRAKEAGTPGETGRIKQVNDHTSKIVYTGVSDQELIRIFGDEAPEGISVYKTLNIDPNKTATISYINKEGQTIATALSIGPDSTGTTLDTLPGYKNARVLVHDTLWGNTAFGKFGITSNKPLAFAVPTSVSFKYTIKKKDITQLCMNYCSTCDYTIQFLLHTDDTSLVIGSKLLPAATCTTPPVKWDTTFTKLMDAGKKYVIEKRVFANNVKPGSSPVRTYLDISIDSIRNTLSKTANDSLQLVYGYLKRNSMDSLYRYLNQGSFIDLTGNADSLYADSSFTKSIGCVTIKIPITHCKKETCPADFENYFNDRWKGTVYADDPGTTYLDYLVPPYGQTTYRFQKGQFNFLINNMLDDGYDCQRLWTCWRSVTLNYKNLKDLSDTTTSGYKLDLMEEFLRCTGRKFAGYSDTDSSKFVGKAYKYFYKPTSTINCDTALKRIYGTLGGWAQDSLVVINPLSKKWENYYGCIRNLTTGASNDSTLNHHTAEGGCQDACHARYGAFKQSVINMYHNDSIYIEGDRYKLKKDTIWGQQYSWSVDTLVSAPASEYFRSLSSVECMVNTLIESCISECTLTMYDTVGGKRGGTAAQIEAVKKAMTWSFELKRSDDGESCGLSWKKLGAAPYTAFNTASDSILTILSQHHYGGNSVDQLRAMIRVKSGGGILVAGNSYSNQGNDLSQSPKGTPDYWVTRINEKGSILWEKRFGGLNMNNVTDIIETKDGGFLIAGSSDSDSTLDKSQNSRGGMDYWIIKLNHFGEKEWDRTYGGEGGDMLSSIVETGDGNFMLGGSSTSEAGFDKVGIKKSGQDYWIIKINKKGNKIWDKTYGGATDAGSILSVIRQTKDGNFVLGGTYGFGAAAFSTSFANDKSSSDFGWADFWIIKIDTAGNKIWDKTYGGVSYDQFEDLLQTPTGDYILVGSSDSPANTGNKIPGSLSIDVWALQINDSTAAKDTIRWQGVYGGALNDGFSMGFFHSISIKSVPRSQNYIIGCNSTSSSGGTKTQNSFGVIDYWILKINATGTKLFDRTYGGNYMEIFSSLIYDDENYFWIAGESQSDTTGNKTVGNYGVSDYWILKARETCTHDSVCFRWKDIPAHYTGDSTTVEFKYLSCDSVNSNYVYNSILLQVQQYIDSSLTDYVKQYTLTCADSIKDSLSFRYLQGFYHYTLYYYDRAGNLVRTVPPNGVNYKDGSNVLVGSRSQHNAHTFVTNYWYNSIKQLTRQQTPDGGTTNFWYDYKGQLRASQNAKQKLLGKYSYTKYDNLGRIVEVGESSDSISTFNKEWNLNEQNFPFLNNKERTYTVYTTALPNLYYLNNSPQRYLQNRVSYTYTDDKVYTCYSYDPHGNVEWLIQDIPALGRSYMRYEYDLISSKVLAVHYNEGGVDEFHHRYTYDTDQRLLKAQTAWGNGAISSSGTLQPQPAVVKQNQVGWDTDATYKYYHHGPLKRTEIGEDHLQGLDYVYTINGWIKGINYPTLASADDPGADNNTTFGKDAFGMVLGYHTKDFNRTSSKYNPSASNLVSSYDTASGPGVSLYNGNISSWTQQTGISGVSISGLMGFKYKYDQLNRIKKEDYRSKPSGSWTDPPTTYDNTLTYDGNGNILTLNRKAGSSEMDDLVYAYTAGTNKLDHVDDNPAYSALVTGNIDIDDQNAANYTYDAIGNLISDAQSTISNIDWNVYGKIKSIKKTNNDSIIFKYDAGGNRIMKLIQPASGDTIAYYYVKDAGGNTMSMYKRRRVGVNHEYRQLEVPLYGSSRIGLRTPDILVKTIKPTANCLDCLGCDNCPKFYWTVDMQHVNGYFARELTKKTYELNDHLGNVRVTVSDRKNSTDSSAVLLSYSNYYAFGGELLGKTYLNGGYRYGFNGKEKDDEIKGNGNNYDYGARMYDPRLGRWLSLDPLAVKYPGHSPYNFCANNPIIFVDQDGRDFDYAIRDVKNKDGTVTRIVDVKVVYNVVNLSSQEINSGHFNTATAELSKGLDYTVLDPMLKKAGVSSVEINVEATFNIVSDFSQIKDNENVLLIVDKVTDGAESKAAGWGDKPGNAAIIEVELTQGAGEKFAAATVHEVGHNLGFEHDESEKQAMNSVNGKNSKLTKDQQKEFDNKYMPAYKGKEGDSGHVGNGNAKAKAKEMLRTKGSSYDHNKARKAKIE